MASAAANVIGDDATNRGSDMPAFDTAAGTGNHQPATIDLPATDQTTQESGSFVGPVRAGAAPDLLAEYEGKLPPKPYIIPTPQQFRTAIREPSLEFKKLSLGLHHRFTHESQSYPPDSFKAAERQHQANKALLLAGFWQQMADKMDGGNRQVNGTNTAAQPTQGQYHPGAYNATQYTAAQSTGAQGAATTYDPSQYPSTQAGASSYYPSYTAAPYAAAQYGAQSGSTYYPAGQYAATPDASGSYTSGQYTAGQYTTSTAGAAQYNPSQYGYQYGYATGYAQPYTQQQYQPTPPQAQNPYTTPGATTSAQANDKEFTEEDWKKSYVTAPAEPKERKLGTLGKTGTSAPAVPTLGGSRRGTARLPAQRDEAQKLTVVREGGGEVWEDESLLDWDTTRFRLFAGNLAGETTDETLMKAFAAYNPSRTRVIREKRTGKSKGYGFIEFFDHALGFRAAIEMNNKYVASHPIKLSRSKAKVNPTTTTAAEIKAKGRSGNPDIAKPPKKETDPLKANTGAGIKKPDAKGTKKGEPKISFLG